MEGRGESTESGVRVEGERAKAEGENEIGESSPLDAESAYEALPVA